MVKIAHIVPVGHTKETLTQSIDRFSVSKVIFVLGKDTSLESEKRAHATAKEVEKEFPNVEFENILVDVDDIYGTATKLIEKIRHEKAEGYDVKINLSGSLRPVGLAGYMAALFTSTPVYVGTPSYSNGRANGIRNLIDIPLIPLKKFSREKMNIIKQIGLGNKTLKEMIKDLPPESNFASEQSRLSYHLKDLKNDGIIKIERKGREINIELSELGNFFFKSMNETDD